MPKHLSFSQLTKIDGCVRYWEASRGPVAEMPSRPRDVGKLSHAIIESYLAELLDGKTGEDAEYGGLVAAASTSAHYEEAAGVFRRWKARWAVPTEAIFGVEAYLTRTIEGVPPLIGYADVIYREGSTLVVRDFKSSFSSDVTPEHEFQLDLMAWMLAGEYPKFTIASEIEFLRSGIVKRREFDGYRSAITEQRIRAAYARIERAEATGEYPETPGKQCGYCPRAVSCATAALAAGQGDVLVAESDAQVALVDLARLEAAAARLKASLKSFVSKNGDVSAHGLVAAYETSETTGCTDTAGLVAALGVERAAPFLSLNGRAKGVAALKKDAALAPFFGVTATRNTFKIGGSLETELSPESVEEFEVA